MLPLRDKYLKLGSRDIEPVWTFAPMTNLTAWLAKGLNPGDLHSLIDVASGLRPNGLSREILRITSCAPLRRSSFLTRKCTATCVESVLR